MTEEIVKLDLKSIKDILVMHEDVSSALSALPDFGYKNLEDIRRAEAMLDELRMMLHGFIYFSNSYQDSFNSLIKLLNDTGLFQCVEDLMKVRGNSRGNFNYAAKLKVLSS